MNLRELKKEIESLPDIKEQVVKFQEQWIKPIRENSNTGYPFLSALPIDRKRELNQKLKLLQNEIDSLHYSQSINEKLQYYARYLVELKLASFQGNKKKATHVTGKILNDSVLNMTQTIADIKEFERTTQKAAFLYNEITTQLHQELSLEHSLVLLEKPHQQYLRNLSKISQQQKEFIQQLGTHFIVLAKQTGK